MGDHIACEAPATRWRDPKPHRIIMRKIGFALALIVLIKSFQTDAFVIRDRDSSDLEPNLHHAVKRIFSSYYHNRNAPSTKYRYPFVVHNPPTTQKKLKKLKNVKTAANSTAMLRNLMKSMTDDEIIDEILNMEMDKAVVLAKDIVDDLKAILVQVRSTENQLREEQKELENTIERALDPTDPGRLLRLS